MKPTTPYYQQQQTTFGRWLYTLGYSSASEKHYLSAIGELFIWLEHHNLYHESQVTTPHMNTYQAYLHQRPNQRGGHLSPAFIQTKLSGINLYFSYCQQMNTLQTHPMPLTGNKTKKTTRTNLLSKEDIHKLYTCCHEARERALLSLLYGCGLRKQEAVNLNIEDLNLKDHIINITGKGRKHRQVPLGRQVCEDLKNYYYHERHTYVSAHHTRAFMLNNSGTRMQGHTYYRLSRALQHRAGLQKAITLHHYRHAIATHLLEAGTSIEKVKDFLGHKTLEATKIYTHISPQHLKDQINYETQTIPETALPAPHSQPVPARH